MKYADRHDLDKLARWQDGFAEAEESGFPVYAVFLVTGEHREAHDIFRRYRTDFEALGAGFSNLVIFGQHGTSTTVTSMLAELGLPAEKVPVLALSASTASDSMFTIELPKGTVAGLPDDSGPWGQALTRIGDAAQRRTGLDWGGFKELVPLTLGGGSLADVVEKALSVLKS